MSATRAKFSQLNIVSANPEASLEFYRRLGVEIPEEAVWRTRTGIHHVSARAMADGEAPDLDIDSIAFAQKWNSGWSGRDDLKGRVVVGFHVPSRNGVDELYLKMTKAGYAGLQSPYDAIWGARYAVVEDPDGIAVGLMSPVSPELRSKPPDI
jgi:catechol 2,3-dioxygenase-like lactoylglutathione lyase family enzyme